MKPRIGRKIYCVYEDAILVKEVAFLGKESFIIDSFGSDTAEDSWEWCYKDYDKEWFTSITKAKKELCSRFKKDFGDKVKVVKMADDWYVLEEDKYM